MPILSDTDISAIQADYFKEYDRLCTVVHRAEEADGAGGWHIVETRQENIPCFIMPEILTPRLDLSEKVTADNVSSAVGYIFTIPSYIIVAGKDHIIAGPYNYEVSATIDYPKSNNIVSRVLATQLR